MDEKEKSEVAKLDAETAKIEAETEKVYVDIDVTNAEELRIKKGLQAPNLVAGGNPGEPKSPAGSKTAPKVTKAGKGKSNESAK